MICEKQRPEIGKFYGFDHVVFWVGNAKQAASYYTSRFGFEYLAYQGLETGSRDIASHVIKKNNVILVFQSSYDPADENNIGRNVLEHGDGVRDIAFTVENCKKTLDIVALRGGNIVKDLQEIEDSDGKVIMASVQTFGDTIHTFVERKNYKGIFLPGFKKHPLVEQFNKNSETIDLQFIDHIVGNQGPNDMEPTAHWYEQMLDFHRFWSVDDKVLHTEYSSLRSIVMTDFDEVIKIPINEPAPGKKKSQIQEFVDYYSGAGVQHIAFNTQDIIKTVQLVKNRGVEFLEIPDSYYDNLRKQLPNINIKIKEDIDTLQKLRILVDYDDKGYILQIFTKPVQDRPTIFFEFIQRNNHYGFGVGNFKALFKAIEDEQALRGNLN